MGYRWLAVLHRHRYFCVASEGYKRFFVGKGVPAERIVVTGIPNYDNLRSDAASPALVNEFPYHGYVLVATSDARETFKLDNRRKFIQQALEIANGRTLIFKLHPNEQIARVRREIESVAPHALIFSEGNIDPMIANCEVLITQYSTVVYTGIVLGKEVHSYFPLAQCGAAPPVSVSSLAKWGHIGAADCPSLSGGIGRGNCRFPFRKPGVLCPFLKLSLLFRPAPAPHDYQGRCYGRYSVSRSSSTSSTACGPPD